MKRSRLKQGNKPLKRTAMKRKGRKKPTAEQQRYHDQVRDLGCLICGQPAAIHHVREGLGMGQAVDHDRVLPLCYSHHQGEELGDISLHGNTKEFEEMYGTEIELEKLLGKCFQQPFLNGA